MKEFRETMIEWMFILFTTLVLPCFLTLWITGTKEKEKTDSSGITVVYKDGTKADLEEFLPYAIAGEIELSYQEETLKAQAIIARTNCMREVGDKKEIKMEELSIAYLTPEKFQESLGEKAREKIWRKLKKAVESTKGMVLTYEGAYIEAMYHGISIGNTVSAQEIFGKSRPYLVSVSSSQDVEAEDYMAVKEWTRAELLQKLQKEKKALSFTADTVIDSLQIKEKTENGYVKEIGIGEESMTGEEWQELFDLPSTNFYLEVREETLAMITLGKGHGIGMSQYGANCMAKEKKNYEEILKKYYPGTKLQEALKN